MARQCSVGKKLRRSRGQRKAAVLAGKLGEAGKKPMGAVEHICIGETLFWFKQMWEHRESHIPRCRHFRSLKSRSNTCACPSIHLNIHMCIFKVDGNFSKSLAHLPLCTPELLFQPDQRREESRMTPPGRDMRGSVLYCAQVESVHACLCSHGSDMAAHQSLDLLSTLAMNSTVTDSFLAATIQKAGMPLSYITQLLQQTCTTQVMLLRLYQHESLRPTAQCPILFQTYET